VTTNTRYVDQIALPGSDTWTGETAAMTPEGMALTEEVYGRIHVLAIRG
jgi:hypothetical protein